MKKQKAMSQMKGQDKPPEKQLNEVEIGNLPEKGFRIMVVKMIYDLRKRIQNNDSENDSGSWIKNGGKYWEDIRNVYQRHRRTKEETEMNNMLEGSIAE